MSDPLSTSGDRLQQDVPRSPRDATGPIDSMRLARMISHGLMPFPDDLPSIETRELLLAVRTVGRKRLIQLVAQAIAQDILSDGSK